MSIGNWILRNLTAAPGVLGLWTRFPAGSVDLRVRYGVWTRPHYAFGVYYAADLAKKLGLASISVIEFGVAGGRGLVALEAIASRVSYASKISISVVGFDTGLGMAAPEDYRDLPHVWGEGFYKMDVAALRKRLAPSTQLLIGDVSATIPGFLNSDHPPIGFVAFDLDYYSSTKKAFEVFETDNLLPRVYCYFDDIIWPETACHNQYVGELCAIREFNSSHDHQKICPIHLLRHMRVHPAPWNDQMYVLHGFKHPLYAVNITPQGTRYIQQPL